MAASTEKEIRVFKKISWTLNDWTLAKMKAFGNGKQVDSSIVEIVVGDIKTKWAMRFYPNCSDSSAASTSFIGVFMSLNECSSANFTAKYKFEILSPKESHASTEVQRSASELLKDGYGFKKFLSHDDLFKAEKEFVKDGEMVLLCNLVLTKGTAKDEVLSLRQAFADFKKLLDDESLTDFKLKTSDLKILKVHKAFLSARSPVFHAMLRNDMEETQTGIVDIKDFDSRTMKEVLRFIYCNEVEDLDEIAKDLIYAADKYHLLELKKMCIASIVASLTVENVLKSLEIADDVSEADMLLEHCLDIIMCNYGKISECQEWKELPKNLIMKVTQYLINILGSNNTIHI